MGKGSEKKRSWGRAGGKLIVLAAMKRREEKAEERCKRGIQEI